MTNYKLPDPPELFLRLEAVISRLVNMDLWASYTYLFQGECMCVHECLSPL